jgi:hypothetical protein
MLMDLRHSELPSCFAIPSLLSSSGFPSRSKNAAAGVVAVPTSKTEDGQAKRTP